MKKIEKYNIEPSIFEKIRRVDENGIEYWMARELGKALDYSDFGNFTNVINKAKIAYENSGQAISNHLGDITEMVKIGSGVERGFPSFKLSRHMCYLVVLNADARKSTTAMAIDYFSADNAALQGVETKYRQLSIKDELTDFLLYTTPNGKVNIETILRDETLWLNQSQMAQLFDVNVPNISKHLKDIFESGELDKDSVISILETTAQDGKRYNVIYYNLDAVISVGYRVNSSNATQFRIWATNTLREFIIKGFVLDDNRLKNGQYFGRDYFEDLLEQVRSIRSSERRIYQKITDIFAACSSDYNKDSVAATNFYTDIQNKFHYAISGQTAAEIVFHAADAKLPFMGLQTFKNAPLGRVVKSDVSIAKNYLSHDKITQLERLTSSYFDYIERMIERRTMFTMSELASSVIKFLEFNEYEILEGFGKKSHYQAKKKAESEYNVFNKRQLIESDFDMLVKISKGKSKLKREER